MPTGSNFARILFVSALGYAAFGQVDSSARPIHIGVQARTLEGAPIERLRAEQFDVSAAGKRLPVSLVPAIQSYSSLNASCTFVLLMVAPTSSYSSEDSVADLLTKNLPEDFRSTKFAVLEKTGELTPYAGSRSELIRFLRGFHHPIRKKAEALDELGRKMGRRALIYLSDNGVDIPASTRRSAELAAALTYQVGGNRGKNYVVGDESFGTVAGFSPSMGDHFSYGPVDHGGVGILAPPPAPVYNVTKSIREVLVVRTLRDAYRNIEDDGRGYYTITLSVPENAQMLDLKLDLKYDYQITAQDYAADRQHVPELRVDGKQLVPLLNRGVVNRR